jgi:glucosamine-6-phosphate deaminase
MLNPESTGVDTAYKVLQILARALRMYSQESGGQDLEIWGYRSTSYCFHPAYINTYIPVGMDGFAIAYYTFMNSLISQTEISFPSYEHDGPLIELAQKIQVEQYQAMKTLLGQEYFLENSSAQIRSTKGLVYLKRMTRAEFWLIADELNKIMENA